VSKLQSTAKEMEASAAKKEKEIAKVTQDNAELQATRDAAEAEAEAAEREHADVQAGKGSSQGGLEGNTFAEQLASLKVRNINHPAGRFAAFGVVRRERGEVGWCSPTRG